MVKIKVAGKINCQNFQQSRVACRYLEERFGVTCEVVGLFETQWEQYLSDVIQKFGRSIYAHKKSPIVIKDDTEYIGSFKEFKVWLLYNYSYQDSTPILFYKKLASQQLRNELENSNRDYIFFDFQIGEDPNLQRIIIELMNDKAPQTSKYFKLNCFSHYKGTILHRVVQNAFIQGGQYTQDGQKLEIEKLNPESYSIKHERAGIVGLSGTGFYITLNKMPSLDNVYVAFGRIIMGMRILKIIGKMDVNNQRPVKSCIVVNCGSLQRNYKLPAPKTLKDIVNIKINVLKQEEPEVEKTPKSKNAGFIGEIRYDKKSSYNDPNNLLQNSKAKQEISGTEFKLAELSVGQLKTKQKQLEEELEELYEDLKVQKELQKYINELIHQKE